MTVVRWWAKIRKPVPNNLKKCAYCEDTVTDWRHYTNCDYLPDKVIKAKNKLSEKLEEQHAGISIQELLEDTNL